MRSICKWLSMGLFFICLIFSNQFIFAQSLQDLKLDIYSKLLNPHCYMPLNECDCPEAKEMKSYIDALLENRVSKDEIFYRVAKKFSLNVIVDLQLKAEIEKRLISEAGEKRPQLVLESSSFNFGKVSKKQGTKVKVFKLYNKGNSDLIITNIRVSCSCVTASLKVDKNKSPYFGIAGAGPGWQVAIKPGSSGELEVVADLAHPSMGIGRQMRDIFVASNDSVYPEVSLRVEAEVTD